MRSTVEAAWPPLQQPPRVGERYEHRNGKEYEVIALAKDDDAQALLVIHRGADGNVWSRPIGNFMALMADGGARFRGRSAVESGH